MQNPHVTARARGAPESELLRSVSVWLALFVFWVLLSGYFTAFLLAAGAGCAAAVVFLGRRMAVIDREGHPLRIGLRAVFAYWPWLIKEIAKSAWDVTRVILSPRLDVRPRLVRFRPSQTTDVGLVIHANSITLTPGTISVEVGRQEFLVHALTQAGAESIHTGNEMDRRVAALERGA